MWSGDMSKENCTKYEEVFETAETYDCLVYAFIQQIDPFTMRLLELCTALIYWTLPMPP